MSDTWKDTFARLQEYISAHPSIEIGTSAICIPGDVRPGFYGLFNAVCADFVKNNFQSLLEKGNDLSTHWTEASRLVIDRLKLETINVPADAKWFLLDPLDGLTRGLVDPLFDVLKGKQDIAAFERQARQYVQAAFDRLFREGYRLWATISLIRLLEADSAYRVPAVDYYEPSIADFTDLKPGTNKELVPPAREATKITFEHVPLCTFLVPTVIVHAARINSFAAFGTNFCEARWDARIKSAEHEWQPIAEIEGGFGHNELWPSLAVYLNKNVNELNLVADYYHLARPDIIVEFKENAGWYERRAGPHQAPS